MQSLFIFLGCDNSIIMQEAVLILRKCILKYLGVKCLMSETYFKIVQGEGEKKTIHTYTHIDIHIYGYGEFMDA